MGFSGYYQELCRNGHYSERDCYELMDEEIEDSFKCPHCDEGLAFWCLVGTTNEDHFYCRQSFILKSEAEVQTCNLGRFHEVKPAVYELDRSYKGHWVIP